MDIGTKTTTVPSGYQPTDQEEFMNPVMKEYFREKLLRWRWRGPSQRRVKEYLVLWKNWSIDDASWVPEENFDYPRELKKMIARDKPIEDPS